MTDTPQAAQERPGLASIAEVARVLNVTPMEVNRLLDRGLIAARRFVEIASLDAYRNRKADQ